MTNKRKRKQLNDQHVLCGQWSTAQYRMKAKKLVVIISSKSHVTSQKIRKLEKEIKDKLKKTYTYIALCAFPVMETEISVLV